MNYLHLHLSARGTTPCNGRDCGLTRWEVVLQERTWGLGRQQNEHDLAVHPGSKEGRQYLSTMVWSWSMGPVRRGGGRGAW